jgi:selenocysteine-specific elongation factor
MALLTPGHWAEPTDVDVALDRTGEPDDGWTPPATAVLHLGSGRTTVRVRPLAGHGRRLVARLALREALALHVGDRALLRDPGQARGETRVLARVTILDVDPPALRRRGDAARRGRDLLDLPGPPDGAAILARRGAVRASDLTRMGVRAPCPPVLGEWLLDPAYRQAQGDRLAELVRRHALANPLEPGLPVEAARRAPDLPERRLVGAVLRPPLRVADGRIRLPEQGQALPAPLAAAVGRVLDGFAGAPFRAPEHAELAALGLDRRALAAAERAGRLLRVTDGVVLGPDADVAAARVLRELPQPFTAAQARKALDTTRRVVIPLLELLDRKGLTERVDDSLRRVRAGG